MKALVEIIVVISIHAPVKGATRLLRGPVRADRHFNPRSREGSDRGGNQSDTPCRNFNPRSREGSDPASANLRS